MVYKKIKNLLPSRIQHQLMTVKRYQRTPLTELTSRYEIKKAHSGAYYEAAKKLHAEIYLSHRFVTQNDLTNEGILSPEADPYQDHADYFVAIDRQTDEVVALVRQIHQRSGKSLPVLEHSLTSKKYHATHRNDIIEVSAFAKKRGVDSRLTILLFAEMLSHSKINDHQYWVFACDSKVYRRLKTLFGRLLQKTGPETYYMGSKVIPAEVDLDRALKQLRRNYRYSLPPLRQVRRFLYDSLQTLSHEQGGDQSESAIFWDQYAKAYDGLLHLAPYRHLVDHVSDITLQSSPERVLDLGCGTGNVAVALLTKDSRVMVDAVDWSAAMLNRIRVKTLNSRLTVRRRDALKYLETTDLHYDVIVLNNVVYTIGNREKFWKLIYNRLNPGGRVIVAHPDTGNSSVLLRDHASQRSYVSLLRPRLIMIGMFDAVISLLGMSRKYTFTDQASLLDEAKNAGLALEGEVGRCYGGHTNGIDILFTLKKQ